MKVLENISNREAMRDEDQISFHWKLLLHFSPLTAGWYRNSWALSDAVEAAPRGANHELINLLRGQTHAVTSHRGVITSSLMYSGASTKSCLFGFGLCFCIRPFLHRLTNKFPFCIYLITEQTLHFLTSRQPCTLVRAWRKYHLNQLPETF